MFNVRRPPVASRDSPGHAGSNIATTYQAPTKARNLHVRLEYTQHRASSARPHVSNRRIRCRPTPPRDAFVCCMVTARSRMLYASCSSICDRWNESTRGASLQLDFTVRFSLTPMLERDQHLEEEFRGRETVGWTCISRR